MKIFEFNGQKYITINGKSFFLAEHFPATVENSFSFK